MGTRVVANSINSPSSTDGRKILRLRMMIHGHPTFVVKAAGSSTVRRVKLALEMYRGISVCNHQLTLQRSGRDEYENMDDQHTLDHYRMSIADRLYLTPVFRTGPGYVHHHKTAWNHFAEETDAELLKLLDEQLVKSGTKPSSSGRYVLISRSRLPPRLLEIAASSDKTGLVDTSISSVAISEGGVISISSNQPVQDFEIPTAKEEPGDPVLKEKVKALKEMMEKNRRLREAARNKSKESSGTSGHGSSETRIDSAQPIIDSSPPPPVIASEESMLTAREPPSENGCDRCKTETASEDIWTSKECTRQFCTAHVDHSCRESKRCQVCGDLVLTAGDRYKCPTCQNPLCRQHIKEPCEGGHGRSPSSTKTTGGGRCKQQ